MTSDLELYPDTDRTPSTLFASPDPAAIVAQATRIANEIAPLIREQRLVKRIGQSDHVFLEGWTLAGTMLGVFPITVSSGPIVHEGEVLGYQATVEARTMAGQMVGRADAQCTHDENAKWRDAPSFQLRSMAITRASSKALRMPLGFVMHLAGYDATPAEEMEAAAARGETVTGGHGVQLGWKDLGEQQRGHADVGKTIEEHGLRQWVAEWISSKGYGPRPWAKPQLTQLRRALEQEIHWRQQSDPAEQVCQHISPVSGAPCLGLRGASVHEGRDVYQGDVLERAHPFQPQMSDPPARPTPPGRDQGGSDPTSEGGEADGTDRHGGSQQHAAGLRAAGVAERPPSDPTSPAPVRGRQKSGTSTSGVGSSTASAGAPGDGSPAGSPTPDPTSPPDPAGAQKAAAAERGDAKVGPAESGSLAGEGSPEGGNGGSAGPASEDLISLASLLTAYKLNRNQFCLFLRKEAKEDFGKLTIPDLDGLSQEQLRNAEAYLAAGKQAGQLG